MTLVERWRRSWSAAERWLLIPACAPLLAVPAHWWWYPSDSVVAHFVLAGFQALAGVFVVALSNRFSRTSRRVSVHDSRIGLVTTGLAGFSATMFVLMYVDHPGILDEIAPAFMADPPRWWWSIEKGWIPWFLATLVLLFSSAAIRRGWWFGYVGVALIASLFAWARWWMRYELGDELGRYRPSAGIVVVAIALSVMCWLAAAARIAAGITRQLRARRT
jgi:hypothetical protein